MKLLFPLLFCLLSFPGIAQPIDSVALSNFTDAALALQNSEMLRNGTLAIAVQSTTDARPVFALNYNKSVPSASTLKLVTTATSLAVLGGDYTYKTYLEYDGKIERDTLKGNLYLRGTGDPSLGSDRFKGNLTLEGLLGRWEAAVRKAGIRHVTGAVLADPGYFESNSLADSWIWGDIGNYYGAGVMGLNINENAYRIFFRTGKSVGEPAELVKVEPALPNLTFTNKVTTNEAGTGDQVIVYSNPLSTQVILTGTVPKSNSLFSLRGSLPNGAFQAAWFFQQYLQGHSISVASSPGIYSAPLSSGPFPRTVLDEVTSPPLRQICEQTNLWSVNLFADALLKSVGKRLNFQSDYDGAVQSLTKYWTDKGVDMRGFFIKDGSGLSPSGSLTVQNLTGILAAMAKDQASYRDFYDSIAVLGQSGTVRNLGKGSRAAGTVRAKSGSIEGTRAYAGYVTTRRGERLCFALIAHKYSPDASREVSTRLVKLMTLLGEL